MRSTIIDRVEEQTRLAGHNRQAMLLFKLGDDQLFAINVFKVREVARAPSLERMPGSKPHLAGSCDYRGQTIPVIDLAFAMGFEPLRENGAAHMIVSEFSRNVQGFLISDFNRIVHVDGGSLSTPAPAMGFENKVVAVTRIDGHLVMVVDVEQILASLEPSEVSLSEPMKRHVEEVTKVTRRVLVVDDSHVARMKILKLLHELNMECIVAQDGKEALELLEKQQKDPGGDPISLVVSDIEMPAMDGYALTRAIRESPALRHLKVVLHSSISGMFNESLVREVQADRFVAKFQPDILASAVIDLLPPAGASMTF